MVSELPIRCTCGTLQGVIRDVSIKYKNHVVCYCDDCQLFAHSLGGADAILDSHGGTNILQMSPANLIIKQGEDKVACLRLRQNGLFRWYASCCRTPVGNTLPTSKVPYLGLVCTGMLSSVDTDEILRAMGPVYLRVNARYARGDISGQCHERIPLTQLFPMATKLLHWRLQGGIKSSALFNGQGLPVVEPHVLSDSELDEAMKRREVWLQQ